MHRITPLDHTHYDEMLAPDQDTRPSYQHFANWLNQAPLAWLRDKQSEADTLFRRVGITFAVYGDESGSERLIPFDTIPRIISASEWKTLEAGCIQRVTALNRFLHDIYHEQDILKAGIIPPEQILTNAGTSWPCRASTCRARCTPTSPGWTSSATATAAFTCWKTICAPRPA
jgi:uncharacterized circularly permuted ATP-grasp superfamily protein